MEKGNLAQVRSACSYAVGDVVGYEDPTRDCAEIVPGREAGWYVLMIEPGRETTAAASLIGRRFGIYLPEAKTVEIRRGRQTTLARRMCPGYLFVFVWDINRHASRLLSCIGVRGILRLADDPWIDTPYARVPDGKINEIRAEENRENPITITLEDVCYGKKKKRQRRSRKAREQRITDNEIVCVRTWSAFADGVAALDDAGKNQALRKALGLAS